MVSKNQIFQKHLAVGSHLLSWLRIKSEGKVQIAKGKERSRRVFLGEQGQIPEAKTKKTGWTVLNIGITQKAQGYGEKTSGKNEAGEVSWKKVK